MNRANAILETAREEYTAMERVPFVVVITTRVRENYGAHDWDGEGECPQHWKYKSGHTYVLEAGEAYREDIRSDNLDALAGVVFIKALATIEDRNDMFEEYVIAATVCEPSEVSKHHCPWEFPTYLTPTDGGFNCRETIVNDAEYGYLRHDVAKLVKTWTMDREGNRSNYQEDITYK